MYYFVPLSFEFEHVLLANRVYPHFLCILYISLCNLCTDFCLFHLLSFKMICFFFHFLKEFNLQLVPSSLFACLSHCDHLLDSRQILCMHAERLEVLLVHQKWKTKWICCCCYRLSFFVAVQTEGVWNLERHPYVTIITRYEFETLVQTTAVFLKCSISNNITKKLLENIDERKSLF